ncbi:MAG: IgGFc-binding protein [Myxococcales bacterium]
MVALPLFYAFAGGGCSSGAATRVDAAVDSTSPSPPGSPDASGGRRGDAVEGPTFVHESCETASRICVGSDVFSCADHQPGEVVEHCSEACSLGRCTALACARAERSEGRRGCRFYGVQMDNVDAEDGRQTMVLLNNGGADPADARIEVPAADGTWAILQSVTVKPFSGETLRFTRPAVSPGINSAVAFRVETTAPVLALAIVDDDFDRMARSSAGMVLLPVQALGVQYMAVTSPASATGAVSAAAGSRAGAGAIAVIATEPNTHLTLRLTAPALVQVVGVLDPPPASYDVPVLRAGDVLQVFSASPGGDLTGSTITSDSPVAVFSGNVFTSYSYEVTGFNGADMAQEQLPPLTSWGHQYVGARLVPQMACDPFFDGGAGLWQVVAAEDNTTVVISPAAGVSVDWPDLSPALNFKLDAGGSRRFFARGSLGAKAPADFLITANGPILLAQWLDCEPGLAWGIDTRLSATPLFFTLPPNFEHEVVVVKKVGTSLTLDGRPLAEDRFTLVSPQSPLEAIRLSEVDVETCADPQAFCDHLLTGEGFGVTWRGMDVVCSYALTVPPANGCVLPTAHCQIF